MTTYKEVDITGNTENQNSAISYKVMSEEGITSSQMTGWLMKNLNGTAKTLVEILNDGCGVAIILRGDEISIIGIKDGAK